MYGVVSVNVLVTAVLLSLGVVDECVSALHMYPEIFDPSKFLARPLPLKSVRPSDTAGDHHLARGFQDDETGFVRSSSESGKTGFVHRENFHRKDGNKYGNEKQTGHGESRRSEEPSVGAAKDVAGGHETGRRIIETDHYIPEPMYEVTEEQNSDYENPDKHKKYGTAAKPAPGQEETDKKKKPKVESQMKASGLKEATGPARRKPRKGGRSNQQNNHNGYESIVYHENERDSMEQGYGKRKAVGKLPTKQTVHGNPVPQGRLLDDDNEYEEDGRHGDEEEENEDDETRHSEHADGEDGDDDEVDTGERGNDSDFGDNYDTVRFDSDFERSFRGHDASFENGHDDGGKNARGKGKGRQHDNVDYDYDEEVDREQVDEAASEDKYRGDDESDEEGEEEEGNGERDDDDGRQYEYASEADSDAQDY
ncbi:YTH domain-containing protein 1-like [Anopheles darlingi]|uniref:YTH domain-containing protein 1-like n=1 Tax=Anopheles darlingi TaxID=43151 RepID=UPI0020FFF75A|nr:YTH domain-containing protein 1-like [Anopheles darlingi]